MLLKRFIFCIFFITQTTLSFSQLDVAASKELIKRVLPKHFNQFEVVYIAAENGQDVFEIKGVGDKIQLSGTNGVCIGSALNYYLKKYCSSDISWNGSQLALPDKLPKVEGTVRESSPYNYRYYLNYVTFNYTMSWWDWERWEKEIDWMALHGINMPLAINGRNSIWQRVYREMGFSDAELQSFFSGPSYSGFNAMGLLDGYGGPLPQSWIDAQEELQKKILDRQRSLGMTPVLPAFTGHVPPGFVTKFPKAKVSKVRWSVFPEVDILDPNDPLFIEIGNKFIKEQTKTYGTDHLYSADTFIEVKPPSNDSLYLSDMSKNIYRSMAKADPKAVWVMQGWMFYFMEKFWGQTQIKALLNAVPDDGMIVLDLWSETRPIWNRNEAYYGKPWLWCMVHNFGGNTNMFAKMPEIAKGPSAALKHPGAGRLSGIGMTMESLEQTPAVYALMMENTWRREPIELDSWIKDYVKRRYGKENIHASRAWDILKKTTYGYQGDLNSGGSRSMITARPVLAQQGVRTSVHSFYDPMELLEGWTEMSKAAIELGGNEGFQYDFVNISRQVLANYADALHQQYVDAYEAKNLQDCKKYSSLFLEVISDMDRLVATRKDFLLGGWLESAKAWGKTQEEKDLFEFNARNLLTMWHGKIGNRLQDYAYRHWSGLLKDYYKVRWTMFFDRLNADLQMEAETDMKKLTAAITDWEWSWVNDHKKFNSSPSGDAIEAANAIYTKYSQPVKKLGNPKKSASKESLSGPEF